MALATRVWTAKSDVYSFGVLLFELYSDGRTPYAHLQATEVVAAVKSGERLARPAAETGEAILWLMRACAHIEPAQRPGMGGVGAALGALGAARALNVDELRGVLARGARASGPRRSLAWGGDLDGGGEEEEESEL